MEEDFDHLEIAKKLAKTMAERANEMELRRLYEETMFEHLIAMDKSELFELMWHG
tara:strand:- start:597 stop:761 length:165 start_codon:yes stop_codon:yes gene_type:complete